MVEFTEFVLPNRRRVQRTILLTPDIESKAHELNDAGFQFEIEILRNGIIHMDCSRYEDDGPIASELSENNVHVIPLKISKMIETAFERWKNLETKPIEIDPGSSSEGRAN